MSIATQILRLRNLRNTLTGILQNKGLISSGQHTLQEDVEAVESLVPNNYNLQNKTIILGSSALEFQYLPDTSKDGFRNIYFPLDNNAIRPEYIVQGKTLLGVTGTASFEDEQQKEYVIFWNISIPINNPQNEIILYSSDASCFGGSFSLVNINVPIDSDINYTPGDPIPNYTIDGSNNYFCCYREDCSAHTMSHYEINYFDNGICYANNSAGGSVMTGCSISNNITNITIEVQPEFCFVGDYCFQIYYFNN